MRPGPFKDNRILIRSIYQQPIRLYVTVTRSFKISGKRMIMIFLFQGLFVDKFAHNGQQFIHIFAALLSSLIVLLEFSCGFYLKHYLLIFLAKEARLS